MSRYFVQEVYGKRFSGVNPNGMVSRLCIISKEHYSESNNRGIIPKISFTYLN